METTIQISKNLRDELQIRKMFEKESYEEIIWNLLEDNMEISEETKKEIEEARKEAREGKVTSFAKVKKELGF
ncbi:MAG: hypothetical protein ABIG37_01325 [Nanoarchaeota archaeon]